MGDRADLLEAHLRRGVEVDAQLVGMLEIRRRTGQGFQSITPRLTPQARCAPSATTSSRAVRPLGKLTVALCSHSGALSGMRFWKKNSPVTPSTQRLSVVGRSRRWRTTASSHSR